MAILVSPSDNTGWGLGTHSMYGGAKRRSDAHPVRVRAHYRAPWGSSRLTPSSPPTPLDPEDTIGATIESVIEAARSYKRRKRRGGKRRRHNVIRRPSRSALYRKVRNLRKQVLRARSKRAAAAVAQAAISAAALPKRNVYWVRDAATGKRVPVSTRPSVTV